MLFFRTENLPEGWKISEWNPFNKMSKERILSSTLLNRFSDTFEILDGIDREETEGNGKKVGLVEYLLIPIDIIAILLYITYIFRPIAFLLAGLNYIVEKVIAGVLTAVLTPIILATHGICQLVNYFNPTIRRDENSEPQNEIPLTPQSSAQNVSHTPKGNPRINGISIEENSFNKNEASPISQPSPPRQVTNFQVISTNEPINSQKISVNINNPAQGFLTEIIEKYPELGLNSHSLSTTEEGYLEYKTHYKVKKMSDLENFSPAQYGQLGMRLNQQSADGYKKQSIDESAAFLEIRIFKSLASIVLENQKTKIQKNEPELQNMKSMNFDFSVNDELYDAELICITYSQTKQVVYSIDEEKLKKLLHAKQVLDQIIKIINVDDTSLQLTVKIDELFNLHLKFDSNYFYVSQDQEKATVLDSHKYFMHFKSASQAKELIEKTLHLDDDAIKLYDNLSILEPNASDEEEFLIEYKWDIDLVIYTNMVSINYSPHLKM